MKLPIQLDRYTLVEPIGAGAFGRVYRAEVRGDMGFVSDFAVKVLDSNVVHTNPNVAAQMADEARLLSQLDHPNIVKVIDFKHVDHFVLGDVYMMVLEFVRGVDVAEVLEHMEGSRGAIPSSAVLHMGLMVADALTHAHHLVTRDGSALGLVHRDLKPHNLMVNFRGQVKILDFGIAKAESARMAAATQEGQTKGTVFYMSPEQLAGEQLDGRSDLYSLGTILFELLLGRRLLDVEVNTPADLARAMHTAFELDVEQRLSVLQTHLAQGLNGDMTPEAIEGWLALLRAVLQKDARYRPDHARIFAEQLEWLRSRHPTASAEKDFWVRVVEETASARAARGGPRMPPPVRPARRRKAQTVDELPMDLSLNESAQDFFGMESGGIAEEAPVAIPRAEVPMTRAMSSVSGTVRSFGSQQVQQISPLTEVIANIGQEPTQRVDNSADSMTVPPVARPQPKLPVGPPADDPRAVEAPTVETPAVVQKKKKKTPRPAPPRSFQEAPTEKPSQAPSAKPRRVVTARRKEAPPNRKPLYAMVAVGLLLLVAVIVLAVNKFGGDPRTVEAPDEDPTATIATAETDPVEATPAPVEEPTAEPPAEASAEDEIADAPTEAVSEPIAEAEPTAAPAAVVEAATPVAEEPTPAPRQEPPRVESATPKPQPKTEPKTQPKTQNETAVAAATGDEVGMLHLSARPRCEVFVDGTQRGTTDDTRRGLALPPGTYKVRFVCADEAECADFARRSGKKTLVVEAGKKTRYHADFYDLNEKFQ